MVDLGAKDVLRLLAKKITPEFRGEVLSDYKERGEGVRVNHFVAANSVKIYDKTGSVLRVETRVQQPDKFKALRTTRRDPEGEAKRRLELKFLNELSVDPR